MWIKIYNVFHYVNGIKNLLYLLGKYKQVMFFEVVKKVI